MDLGHIRSQGGPKAQPSPSCLPCSLCQPSALPAQGLVLPGSSKPENICYLSVLKTNKLGFCFVCLLACLLFFSSKILKERS